MEDNVVDLDERRPRGRLRYAPTEMEHHELLLVWLELGQEMSFEELQGAIAAVTTGPPAYARDR